VPPPARRQLPLPLLHTGLPLKNGMSDSEMVFSANGTTRLTPDDVSGTFSTGLEAQTSSGYQKHTLKDTLRARVCTHIWEDGTLRQKEPVDRLSASVRSVSGTHLPSLPALKLHGRHNMQPQGVRAIDRRVLQVGSRVPRSWHMHSSLHRRSDMLCLKLLLMPDCKPALRTSPRCKYKHAQGRSQHP
jgi:hypothetical protein